MENKLGRGLQNITENKALEEENGGDDVGTKRILMLYGVCVNSGGVGQAGGRACQTERPV